MTVALVVIGFTLWILMLGFLLGPSLKRRQRPAPDHLGKTKL